MAILRSTFLLCGLFAVTPLAAQEAPTTPSRLHELGFMTGCWRGLSGNGSTIEEQYTTTSDNLILGVTRYLRAGDVLTLGIEGLGSQRQEVLGSA